MVPIGRQKGMGRISELYSGILTGVDLSPTDQLVGMMLLASLQRMRRRHFIVRALIAAALGDPLENPPPPPPPPHPSPISLFVPLFLLPLVMLLASLQRVRRRHFIVRALIAAAPGDPPHPPPPSPWAPPTGWSA